MGKFN